MLFTMDGDRNFRRLITLSLIGLLLIPAGAFAQDRQIIDIKIAGNDHVSSDAILAAMQIKPGVAFSESAMQEAKKSIESMGYFQPGTTVGTETVGEGVRAIFTVIENPVVKEIKISGNTVVPTDKLQGLLRTSVGSVLNTDTLLQKDVRAIETYYEEQGYAAYVTEDIGIDPATGALKIPIMEVRIEDIKVSGNKKTKPYVILREMKQKPGDVYNVKQLHTDLQRIYDLDIFELESASSYKTEPGSDLGKVKLTLPVKEKKTGEVSLGLGYSSRQKLVGQAKLTENNFRGRAQRVSLLWEQSGTRGSSYEVGFYEPWMDRKNTSFGINVYNKLIYRFASSFLGGATSDANDYDERHKGGSVTVSRPFNRMSRGFMILRNEAVESRLASSGQNLNLGNLAQNANVASGTARYANDSRDSQLDPFLGGYNSPAIEFGTTSFDEWGWNDTQMLPGKADGPFAKYSVDLRRYLSKGGLRKDFNERRPRIALRLMAGSLAGKVPFAEQYFVGGAETLRGYKEDRFWGSYMVLASAEYRLPLGGPSLTGVAFADYGDAWGAPIQYRVTPELDSGGNFIHPNPGDPPTLQPLINGFPQSKNFTGYLGYGVGIRVQTPIGPIRLDYGFGSEGSRAHFSIGHVF